LLRRLQAGKYTRATLNKDYALQAVKLLTDEPSLAGNKAHLWRRVAGEDKNSNSQMDVVISLWKGGLISDPG